MAILSDDDVEYIGMMVEGDYSTPSVIKSNTLDLIETLRQAQQERDALRAAALALVSTANPGSNYITIQISAGSFYALQGILNGEEPTNE